LPKCPGKKERQEEHRKYKALELEPDPLCNRAAAWSAYIDINGRRRSDARAALKPRFMQYQGLAVVHRRDTKDK
jgi:hypothetical protein